MEVHLKGKIWKTGNGYVVSIPKALIEARVFSLGQEIVLRTDGVGALETHRVAPGTPNMLKMGFHPGVPQFCAPGAPESFLNGVLAARFTAPNGEPLDVYINPLVTSGYI